MVDGALPGRARTPGIVGGLASTRQWVAGRARQSWPSITAAVTVTVLIIALAFSAGGYFPTAHLTIGSIAFGVLALLVLVQERTSRYPATTLVAVAALAGLGAWTGLSAMWSPDPAAAIAAMQRNLVYLGLFGLAVVAAGSGRHAKIVPWCVYLAILIICGAGLLSRLAPGLVDAPDPSSISGGRLEWPLTYWNAFGCLAAMGVVLGTGLAVDTRARPWLRGLAAGGAVALGAALWLSVSRGGVAAAMVGLAALLLFGYRRGSLLLTMLGILAAIAVAVLRIEDVPALMTDPIAAQANGDGDAVLGQLSLLVLATIAITTLIAAGRSSPILTSAGQRVARPIAIVAVVLGTLGAVGVYAARPDAVEGRSATGVTSASSWLDQRYDEFMSPVPYSVGGTDRLKTAKGTRSDIYRVSLNGFRAHPIWGDGAGGFTPRWYQQRNFDEDVLDAHSLELQTLGELGAIGALLLLALIGAIAVAGVKARKRPGALGRMQTGAVLATCLVWLLHSAVDWDWQMPAVTGVALVLGATVLPTGTRRRRRRGHSHHGDHADAGLSLSSSPL